MRTVLKEPQRHKKYKKWGLAENFPSVPVNLEFWKVTGNDFRRPLDVMLLEDTPGHYEAEDPFDPEETYELPHIETPDLESWQAEMETLKIERDQAIEHAQQLAEQIHELTMELDRKEDRIFRLDKHLGQVLELVEDGYEHYRILNAYEIMKDERYE